MLDAANLDITAVVNQAAALSSTVILIATPCMLRCDNDVVTPYKVDDPDWGTPGAALCGECGHRLDIEAGLVEDESNG